ncbi:MAG: hypothetical protein NC911_00365 [Candidatus Omnitrophica bacterium]|nr:hypothetical protein [Candidatus Omnitrophota bacterium]
MIKKMLRLLVIMLIGFWTVGGRAQQQSGENQHRERRREQNQAGQRGARPQWNPEQMRQRWMENIKERLQPSDEEWKVIQPRLEKVMTLSRQATAMRMMGPWWSGERPGTPSGQTASQEMSPVQKAASELESVLANKESKPAEINAKLTALRETRQKAKKELSEAQAALKEILTPRQEAQLVLMGLLE